MSSGGGKLSGHGLSPCGTCSSSDLVARNRRFWKTVDTSCSLFTGRAFVARIPARCMEILSMSFCMFTTVVAMPTSMYK